MIFHSTLSAYHTDISTPVVDRYLAFHWRWGTDLRKLEP